MQAPARARSIGEGRPHDFAPARAQQKLSVTYPLGEQGVYNQKLLFQKNFANGSYLLRSDTDAKQEVFSLLLIGEPFAFIG